MARPRIEAIDEARLVPFAEFLHRHLMRSRSVTQWVEGLRCNWAAQRPDHGRILLDGDEIVGGIGALYADRVVDGQPVRVCNITSWCVLEAHRQQSMRLAMSLIADKSLEYTDFSPTPVVCESLQFLKFRPLDASILIIPNRPALSRGTEVLQEAGAIEAALGGDAASAYRDHRAFPWLEHRAIVSGAGTCHVIMKPFVYRGTRAVRILHLSAPAVFGAQFGAFSGHLLARGVLTCQIEARLLPERPAVAFLRTGYLPKLILGSRIADAQVDYLYSETMALDL